MNLQNGHFTLPLTDKQGQSPKYMKNDADRISIDGHNGHFLV